jgi:hypothetical protein
VEVPSGPFCVPSAPESAASHARGYDRSVIPSLLIVVGACSIAAGIAVLRSFGRGYRIGRLLAATAEVPIAQALQHAQTGDNRRIRVSGRIDAAEEFEDEFHRPLVWRRQLLEMQLGGRWQALDERVEAVNFELREGLSAIGVAVGELGEGVVVIPRESTGTVADVPDRVPAGIPPETAVRFRIDQVSSVEHAIVVGVPRVHEDGTVRMGAGRARPLVLTTLEVPEAMRILSGGDRVRSWTASSLLVGGVLAAALGFALTAAINLRGTAG